jgi:hypothetical protein
MKKSSEITDSKPLNKLFKDSFKKKLIQQIEAKIITSKQTRLKYGVAGTVVIAILFLN